MNPDGNINNLKDKTDNNPNEDLNTKSKDKIEYLPFSINIIEAEPSKNTPLPIDPFKLFYNNEHPSYFPQQQTLLKKQINVDDEIINNTYNIMIGKQIEKKKENALLIEKVLNTPQKVRIIPTGKSLSYLLENKKFNTKK